MAKKAIESVQDERDAKLYEFAFHLVPKMSEEEALAAFTDIKNQIIASGAVVKNDSAPALLNLVYTMDHTVDSVRSKYNQAYFAWVIFEATGDQILAFKEEVKLRTDIVRDLLITTKNDSPTSAADVAKAMSDDSDEVVESNEEAIAEVTPDQVDSEKEAEDQKVDEAIEKLTE